MRATGISVELLGQLTGARLVRSTEMACKAFAGVCTDSRKLQKGELFVAIRGEKFDGHAFVQETFAKGAAAALVDERWFADQEADSIAGPLAIVPDTVKAFGELARAHRRQFDIPVIAIGGSNGKTTTKEMVASILSKRWHVLKSEASFNNHIGVPSTLLQLRASHRAAVIEFGTNHPGEIAYLCGITEPTHGLITNIMREHMEFFGSIEGVAAEECALLDWIRQRNGVFIVNADDPQLLDRSRELKSCLRHGFAATEADVRGADRGLGPDGRGRLGVEWQARNVAFEAHVGVVGNHHMRNALAAAAVGLHFGCSPEQIQSALREQKPAAHRMEVFEKAGVMILDDTYNANPDSMLAALQTLASIPCKGRRIAALGTMGELGEKSEAYHREIGRAVKDLKLDGLFTVGEPAHFIFEEASPSLGKHCGDGNEVYKQLKSSVRGGDLLLLKASRSVQLDEVVAKLVMSPRA